MALGLASAIVTATTVNAVNAINDYGNNIGVAAYRGTTFTGMTWAATILMLVASLAWLVDCCLGRRKDARAAKDG